MADFAVDALKDKGAPSDQCMLEGLRLWGFDKNKGGDNVVPTGQELVHSDTFGLHYDPRRKADCHVISFGRLPQLCSVDNIMGHIGTGHEVRIHLDYGEQRLRSQISSRQNSLRSICWHRGRLRLPYFPPKCARRVLCISAEGSVESLGPEILGWMSS